MRDLAVLLLTVGIVVGCSRSGSAASSPGSPAGFALRAWTSQAVEPVAGFRAGGTSIAIDDGRLISHGPMMAIYPGPLLPNLQQRPISDAGIEALIAAARAAGMLDGPTDMTGGLAPGGISAHVLFVIDGIEREVVGDPSRQIVCITTPCEAAPGTPESFAGYWARISDPAGWLAGELGAETPFEPERLAILLTAPVEDAALQQGIAAWPLETPMLEFGVDLAGAAGDPPARCGVVEGADLAAALAAFRTANELTRWTDGTGDQLGIVARPLFPGEPDPCGAAG